MKKSAILLCLSALLLSNCGSDNKNLTPYETGLISVRKAPLELPPDYKLRPPKLGESKNISTTNTIQYLRGDGRNPHPTILEREIINKIGAVNVDATIRERLFIERGNILDASNNLSNMLIFWSNFDGDEINFGQAPLSVESKDAWLADRKEQVLNLVGDEDEVTISYHKAILLPGVR